MVDNLPPWPNITPLHPWQLDPGAAIRLQQELAQQIIREDCLPEQIRYVAGVDMAINEENQMARAAVVLLSYPELTYIEQHMYEEPLRMEYIPGLLSFREAPSVLGAVALLKQRPDLILVDGQGIAHPRRLGIASHLGLWLDIPTIGCAKSLLSGTYDKQALGENKGDRVPLVDPKKGNELLGMVLRTRPRVNPLFISPGHKISIESSVKYVLHCCTGYRLPEPTRLADKLSKSKELL